jgi:prolyl-tRNA editing enzyme YbaK/EbsC (Cys-tRNA(Pro) deacylase)
MGCRKAGLPGNQRAMTTPAESGSVGRVRAALLAAGHPDTIRRFDQSTRTSEDAAGAVGCAVGAIAKSLIFRGADSARPVLAIASGAHRVNPALVAAAAGAKIQRADPTWVRDTTGFAIGGVAPVGHLTPPLVLLDDALWAFAEIWAAAGAPDAVFATTPDRLAGLTGGRRVRLAASDPA